MYRRGNKNKIVISLVLLLVLGISIGYATFTDTLKISSGAMVTPDSATFNIDFTTAIDGVITTEITPSLIGNGITAEKAKIDNSTNPTISNLKVDFTEPGQKAIYKFYVYNNGEHLAYLNSINFLNASNHDSFIKCEGEVGTSYVSDACSGINVTIEVGDIITNVSRTEIYNHSIAPSTSEEIILTIEYNEVENRSDGNINITFGDITLVYTTVDSEFDGNYFVIDNVSTSNYVKNNNNGTLTVARIASSTGVVALAPNTLKDYAPNLESGKTYKLTANTTGSYKKIYLQGTKFMWYFDSTRTITEEDLNSIVYWYANETMDSAIISNIRIEEV